MNLWCRVRGRGGVLSVVLAKAGCLVIRADTVKRKEACYQCGTNVHGVKAGLLSVFSNCSPFNMVSKLKIDFFFVQA